MIQGVWGKKNNFHISGELLMLGFCLGDWKTESLVQEAVFLGNTSFTGPSSLVGAWGTLRKENANRIMYFLWRPRMSLDSCMVPHKMTFCQILLGGRLDKFFIPPENFVLFHLIGEWTDE